MDIMDQKSNIEILRAAGIHHVLMMLLNTICQRQLGFGGESTCSLKHLAVTGKVEGRRARGHQRLKFLDRLSTCCEDKVSPTQLIRAAEDRLFWHQMVANVVHGTIK